MINWENAKKSFERKGFKVKLFEKNKDVVEYLESSFDGKTIGFGGSVTLQELGLYETLSAKNTVYWHWITNDMETRDRAAKADIYMLSANGVAETGELINIDGSGNRVSASLYGPKHVIYIIGRNKIEANLEKALWRARNIAAPKNAIRINCDTPCVKSGGQKCFNCSLPQRICNGFVTVEKPMLGQEVELLFVDQDLGY